MQQNKLFPIFHLGSPCAVSYFLSRGKSHHTHCFNVVQMCSVLHVQIPVRCMASTESTPNPAQPLRQIMPCVGLIG